MLDPIPHAHTTSLRLPSPLGIEGGGAPFVVGEGFQREPHRNRFPLAAFFPRFLSTPERKRAAGGKPQRGGKPREGVSLHKRKIAAARMIRAAASGCRQSPPKPRRVRGSQAANRTGIIFGGIYFCRKYRSRSGLWAREGLRGAECRLSQIGAQHSVREGPSQGRARTAKRVRFEACRLCRHAQAAARMIRAAAHVYSSVILSSVFSIPYSRPRRLQVLSTSYCTRSRSMVRNSRSFMRNRPSTMTLSTSLPLAA